MAVSGLGVAMGASGLVLMLSGVRNQTVKDTLTTLLKGQVPAANPTGAVTVGVEQNSPVPAPSVPSHSGITPASQAPSSAGEKTNQATARLMAGAYGWATGAEWTALNNIVMSESGWNSQAQNPGSTAYGIFQFLDGTWASVGYSKTSDPVTQIAAGLAYIRQRYGDPVKAWQFHLANGWY